MKGNEIRDKFLKYFEDKGHTIVSSSSLVPKDDPTLLFTNAGMVQFKSIFLGEETKDYSRAASSQKCVRAGGKHNDLESVGKTARHNTFFEMLGNFSFGDYFKEGAIEMAWEFLSEWLYLPRERLWITVYEDDEEAYRLWKEKIGISPNMIVKMGKKDNFWAMGEVGPCGPCSEILIDRGEETGCGKTECSVGCDCDRFLELWNLVFMQFNRDESGTLHPLPKPNIDTGMGLERITSVLQGVGSNFETDLFTPIIHLIEEISGKQYGINRNVDVSMNVIADHGRALAFLISDGMLPSNEGRGYVLRRIVRRAVRHGKLLGIQAPFLSRITERSADMLSTHYRELESARNLVSSVVLVEEKRFAETLDFGMKLLNDEIERLRFKKEKAFSGEIAFKLYDTYGFPLDLTEDIVGEEGFSIDIDGFYQAMEVQKQRSKESWKGIGERPEEIYGLFSSEGIKTNFIGYDTLTAEVTVLKIVKDNQSVDMVREGETCEFVTDITPFYGEAGGQVGDTGMFSDGGLFGEIVDAQRPFEHIVIHKGILTQGTLMCGKTITLTVSGEKRAATAANHTATHLLHATLREILGDHVKQSGSLVSPERLRFDFTHFTSISDDDLLKIERLVNNKIIENREVTTRVMGMKDAVELGAIAIFEEKYGDTVRMIEIPPYSKELCGGTHTKRTGDIGLFKILSEGGIASGVRRIEALTNKEAIEFVQRKLFELRSLESLINASPGEGVSKLKKILDHEKHLEKEIESFKGQLIKDQAQEVLDKIQLIDGIKVLAAQVEVDDQKTLREFADRVKEKLGTGIILLAGIKDEKVLLTSVVTKDLTRKFDASRIVTAAATVVGGGGGGRKDMAQAGGNLPEKTTEALETVFAYVKNHG